jgi:ABC-2 type transport system permease protein
MRMRTAWVMFLRSLRFTMRKPSLLIMGLLQPVLYLALFGPLLNRLSGAPGLSVSNTWAVFVPGLLVQQAVFSSVFVGMSILAERRSGALDRMAVSGADSLGLLVGRIARDVLVLMAQSLLLCAGALVAGLRVSAAGLLATLVMLAATGLAVAAFSYGIALRLQSEMAFAQLVNLFTLPVVLLSGVLLPMALAPTWLRDMSKANPLSHVVNGARDLFAGSYTSGTALASMAVAAALLVLGCGFGAWSLRASES